MDLFARNVAASMPQHLDDQPVVFRNAEEVRKYAETLKTEWNDTIQIVRKRMAEAGN